MRNVRKANSNDGGTLLVVILGFILFHPVILVVLALAGILTLGRPNPAPHRFAALGCVVQQQEQPNGYVDRCQAR